MTLAAEAQQGAARQAGQGREEEAGQSQEINVNAGERTASLAAGGLLLLLGLSRRSLAGLAVAGVGGALLYRGKTGYCHMYKALGINTASDPERPDYEGVGIHVVESYLINKPADELYDFWRSFDNLPRFMTHLESVRAMGEKQSHWVAKAPAIAGGKVEWDAEIINDEPGKLIAWRSLPGADVDNSGSVHFTPAGERGTAMKVVLEYIPPAGTVGKWLARLFGEEPQQQIHEDLRKFKHLMETGEIPTIQGQPRGSCLGRGKREGQ